MGLMLDLRDDVTILKERVSTLEEKVAQLEKGWMTRILEWLKGD